MTTYHDVLSYLADLLSSVYATYLNPISSMGDHRTHRSWREDGDGRSETVADSVALQALVITLSLISAVTSFIVAASYIHLMRVEYLESQKKAKQLLSTSAPRLTMLNNGSRGIIHSHHPNNNNNASKSRLLSLCFVLCAFCISLLVCLEPLSRSNFADIHPAICHTQGGCILFFMHCMVWLWLSIVLRLFLVLVCNVR